MAKDSLQIHLQWVGVDDVLRKLRELPPNLVAIGLKPAIDKSARLVAKAMKASVTRRRTGLLKQSVGVKVSPNWRKGKVYAVIGPRRSYKMVASDAGEKFATPTKWRANKLRKKPHQAKIIPTRYAHLVEFGHARGKGKHDAKPYPFMRPAMESTKHAAEQLAANELRRSVSKLVT